MPPVADARGVEGLPHLFGAGRTHRTARFVKGQARRFEGQPAVLKQPADIRLRIAHELLVLNTQHLTRQHCIPVVHKGQVAAVVTAKVAKVVAEGLPFGKILLEGTEARIHRMTTGVNDSRLRQDCVDETDMAEVIGQFIREVLKSGAQRPRFPRGSGCQVRLSNATGAAPTVSG